MQYWKKSGLVTGNKYLYMPRTEVKNELDRYHLHSGILLASFVISLLPLIINMGAIVGLTVLDRTSELVVPGLILALVMPPLVLPFLLLGSMERKIKLLSEAMLEKDVGVYVSAGEYRKKLGISTKYLSFGRIDRVYPNGDKTPATIVSKDGVAIRFPKKDLPNLESFEAKWGGSIDFIKDKFYLWHHKRLDEGEFTLLERVDTTEELARLYFGTDVREIRFADTKSVEIVPEAKATCAVVKQ